MTRTVTAGCTTEIINPWTEEPHELAVEITVEMGNDSVPYGSTYVPMPWSDVVEEAWTFDGRPMAAWCLKEHLHFHGVIPSQQQALLERIIEKAQESIDG